MAIADVLFPDDVGFIKLSPGQEKKICTLRLGDREWDAIYAALRLLMFLEIEKEIRESEKSPEGKNRQIALTSNYLLSPTKTRGMRGKPKKNWKDEIFVELARNSRGYSQKGYMVHIPLGKELDAIFQTDLDLEGHSTSEVVAALNLNAKTLGWSAFEEKMFDICVLFVDRHPDRNGAFVYDPAAFGRLLFPKRERLSKKDYERMHFAMTKLSEQRYRFSLDDEFEIKSFRIIADFGHIVKKTITITPAGDCQKEVKEVYAGGIFQIFGGIWEDIKNWRKLAPVEVKSLGLNDQLYQINRTVKYFARINWRKQNIKETKRCRIGMRTLIDGADFSISPSHEKREIERLHERLDELVREGLYAEWWIEEAKGGGRIPRTWYKKVRLYDKKSDSTRWERIDKIYCFGLTDGYISFCPEIPKRLRN